MRWITNICSRSKNSGAMFSKQSAALLKPDGDEEVQGHLQQAAGRLLTAREVLYPIAVHVLDIALLDPKTPDAPLPAAFERGFPLNVVATGQTLEKLAAVSPEQVRIMKEKLTFGGTTAHS